jgi:hypothetical protein
MQWKLVLPVALYTSYANALLRFSCSQLVTERFDPLVTPGQVAPHLHQIVGGNAFNITMDPNNDLPKLSTCTTCTFSEDFSNYWTAVLFYKAPNGTYKRVGQQPAVGTGSANGGMTVYYMQGEGPSSFSKVNRDKLTAFKKGFRMIVGDAMLRSHNTTSDEAKALSFRCFNANRQNLIPMPGEVSWAGRESADDTYELPKKACAGGIRAQIYYPTCWDGKNLDSPDHKSHTAYRTNGKCPNSHPVQLPQLFLETIWDTAPFNANFPKDGTQPFVYSMGDPQGFGQHADYVFGWKDDSLQKAMDNCYSTGGDACRGSLKSQTNQVANQCTQKARVDEDVNGWLKALPGCNPIQAGPGRASPASDCGAPTTYLP